MYDIYIVEALSWLIHCEIETHRVWIINNHKKIEILNN